MLYFFHHYELPLILQHAHIQQILLRHPQSEGAATIGVNTVPGTVSSAGNSSPATSSAPGQTESRTSTFRRMVRGEGLELVIQQVLARRNEAAGSAEDESAQSTDLTSDPPEPEPDPDPIQDEDVWDIVRDEIQQSQSDLNGLTVRDRDSGISDTSLTDNAVSLSENGFHLGSQADSNRADVEESSAV